MSSMTVNIDPALAIDGWMTPKELQWLSEQAQWHHRIVELGCFRGRSTRALADHCPGIVYAIDCWKIQPYMPPTWSAEFVWEEFTFNLQEHLRNGKVVPIRADHGAYHMFPPEWVRGNPSERPDMVFIDGDHTLEAVRRDILAWRSRIAPGGLLCGHDANNSDWPDVDKALAELLPEAQVVPGTQIWWFSC